jgi:hypothetical protein
MRSRPLSTALLVLASVSAAARADYVNGAVSLGGYVLDAKDAPHDGDFYQMERINVSALKNGVALRAAYGYSDFYDKRPNTYMNSNRLALANASYTPPMGWLSVGAGRDFEPMIFRSLYYDGGDVRLRYNGMASAELFGGFGVPTAYQEDIFNFERGAALIGGKLAYSPISALAIHLDGLVNGAEDDGTLGGDVQGSLGDRLTLNAASAFRLDSSSFSQAEIAAVARVRGRDEAQIRYGMIDGKVDSTRSYDYFVNPEHQYLMAGYTLAVTENASLSLDYGLIQYRRSGGQSFEARVNAYGAFFKFGKEVGTIPKALDMRIGYGGTYVNRYRIDVSGGYVNYDVDDRNTGLRAYDFSVQPGIILPRGLEITAAYELLHNRLYDRDHRFFFGVKENFHRGLSK